MVGRSLETIQLCAQARSSCVVCRNSSEYAQITKYAGARTAVRGMGTVWSSMESGSEAG